MFYEHFIIFNWFCGIFGFWKPFKNPSKNKLFFIWRKIWPLFIISCMIANYFTTNYNFDSFDIKSNLSQFAFLNQLLCNVGIIIIEMTNSQDVYIILYQTINKCFQTFKVSDRNLKYIAYKLYFWMSIPTIIFIGGIIWEISLSLRPPFILLIKMPSFITIFHLVLQLYLILSILKLINSCLSKTLFFCDNFKTVEKTPKSKSLILYLLDTNEILVDNAQVNQRVDILFLCRTYDDLSTCMKLLEKYHGLQVFNVMRETES